MGGCELDLVVRTNDGRNLVTWFVDVSHADLVQVAHHNAHILVFCWSGFVLAINAFVLKCGITSDLAGHHS